MAGVLLALLAGTTAGGSVAASAGPDTVDVFAGESIQAAINSVDPGGTVHVHPGHYRENLEISKPVTVAKSGGQRRPTIDGECDVGKAIRVLSDGVTLRGLRVVGAGDIGASPSEVDYTAVVDGTMERLVVKDTCGGLHGAEYGINLDTTNGRMDMIDNVAAGGFTDAGLYVGAITATGPDRVLVRGNESRSSTRGLIVEFSHDADVVVKGNRFQHNRLKGEGPPVGIFVLGSDDIVFERNRVLDNGSYGFLFTSGSSHNRLNDNVARGNGVDVRDRGDNNCGAHNKFGSGNSIPHC